MQETTGALAALSGSQESTPDPTATQAGLRASAAQGRAKVIADHWDETYIKPIAFRAMQEIQRSISTTPLVDPQTGQVVGQIPQPNIQLIIFWMRNIGWSEEKIVEKINDSRFMQALLRPIEESQIKPTGTNTVANRLAAQSNFNNAIQVAAQTGEAQFIKWDEVARERLKINNVKNPDRFVYTQEELLDIQIRQIEQMLTSRVDVNTGLTLSNEQLNSLNAQLADLVQQKEQEFQGVAILPPSPPRFITGSEDEVLNNDQIGEEDRTIDTGSF